MIRSYLFTPATSERRMMKALESAADAVIFDLEDAVAVEEKPGARRTVVEFLKRPRGKPVYVRVNALSTPFAFDDLVAVGEACPEGIVLPKVETESDLRIADWMLGQAERGMDLPHGRIDIIPIIETAKGIAGLASFAGAVPRVRRVAFGAVDLALDMDIDPDDEAGALSQARFAVALASRAAGLESPVDSAFIDIAALDRLLISTINGRRMGYRSRSCIHPSQIETVNSVFTPSALDVERARRIVAAFGEAEGAGVAAFKLDGVMIDYPVVEKARRVLAQVAAIEVRTGRLG